MLKPRRRSIPKIARFLVYVCFPWCRCMSGGLCAQLCMQLLTLSTLIRSPSDLNLIALTVSANSGSEIPLFLKHDKHCHQCLKGWSNLVFWPSGHATRAESLGLVFSIFSKPLVMHDALLDGMNKKCGRATNAWIKTVGQMHGIK
jgi:hypothetical protein